MKYATEKTFDGQRASVGRAVVVKQFGMHAEAGIVSAICDDDSIEIYCLSLNDRHDDFTFVSTKTEDDINALSEGAWTWPVRV